MIDHKSWGKNMKFNRNLTQKTRTGWPDEDVTNFCTGSHFNVQFCDPVMNEDQYSFTV